MRILISIFLFLFISQYIFSQNFSLGFKGGLNKGLREGTSELAGNGGVLKPDMNLGFHAGVFAEKSLTNFFIRSEVLYLHSGADYVLPVNLNIPEVRTTYNLDRAIISLLFGYKLSSRFDVFIGPFYQNILKNEMEGNQLKLADGLSKWGGHIGFKFEVIRNLELSIMYDHTFDSTSAQGLIFTGADGNNYNYVVDEGRLNQILISLNFAIFNSDPSSKRRQSSSGRGCYF